MPDDGAILKTSYGKGFTVNGFGQWMRDAITAAGLPLECKPHGLRKAAGRALAEANCTSHEVMSVLGHKTLQEASVTPAMPSSSSWPQVPSASVNLRNAWSATIALLTMICPNSPTPKLGATTKIRTISI